MPSQCVPSPGSGSGQVVTGKAWNFKPQQTLPLSEPYPPARMATVQKAGPNKIFNMLL